MSAQFIYAMPLILHAYGIVLDSTKYRLHRKLIVLLCIHQCRGYRVSVLYHDTCSGLYMVGHSLRPWRGRPDCAGKSRSGPCPVGRARRASDLQTRSRRRHLLVRSQRAAFRLRHMRFHSRAAVRAPRGRLLPTYLNRRAPGTGFDARESLFGAV